MERSYSLYNPSSDKVKGRTVDLKCFHDYSDQYSNSLDIHTSKSHFKSTIITGTLTSPLCSTFPVRKLDPSSQGFNLTENYENLKIGHENNNPLNSKEHFSRISNRYKNIPTSQTHSYISFKKSFSSEEFDTILNELEEFTPRLIQSESPIIIKNASMKLPGLELDNSPKYQLDFQHTDRLSTNKLTDFVWKKSDFKSAGRLPKLAPVTPERFYKRKAQPASRHKDIMQFILPEISSDISNRNPLDVIEESAEKEVV